MTSILPSPDACAGRHAGRPRIPEGNWAWTACWIAAAAFGAVPLSQGAPEVAGVYWTVSAGGLAVTWTLMPRGRHRRGKARA